MESGTNRDTVIISAAGQQFVAEQLASDSEMGLMRITSGLDEFRSAVKSMNEKLPVNWKAMVDPYNTITNLAKTESRLKQLADPTVSHNDEEFLIFHNCTMYRAAKAEYIKKTEELYNAMNGVPLNSNM